MNKTSIQNPASKAVMELLEQNNSKIRISRTENYQTIQNLLDKDEIKDTETIERILALCIQDTNTIMNSAYLVNIISTIVSKVKMGTYDPKPDLLPSAVAMLNLLKKIALFNKAESLIILCFRTLLLYPDNILLAVTDNLTDVIELCELYCHIRMTISIRLETYDFLLKLLTLLPHEKMRLFIENGLSIWISKVIAMAVYDLGRSNGDSEKIMGILEIATDGLMHIDYTENTHWHSILECICDNKQYPAVMKSLLNAGNEIWYRLWIMFTRLLKHQVTQSLNGIGSPINLMLPVVEIAFKLDSKSRCNAFQCWIALIDSFASHSAESKIAKTMNLLLIPLKANNAKTPEIILAKFKCWWHLLLKFQNKMDKFHNKVIDCFIKSCFGKHDNANIEISSVLVMDNVRKLHHQAIVEIFGHVDCEGCTELPKLTGKLINTQNLVDNWKQWIYILTAIFKSLNKECGLTKKQATCLLKSFIMTIGELPKNNIRKDLFDALISHVPEFLMNCNSDTQQLDMVFSVLLVLFDEDDRIRKLIKSDNKVVIKFIKIILDDSFHIHYKSLDTREWVTKFKTVTKVIFVESLHVHETILDELLISLPLNDYGLLLWTGLMDALSESLREPLTKYTQNMDKLLLWPLKSFEMFTEVKIAAMTWYTTYNSLPHNKNALDKDISVLLYSIVNNTTSTVYFRIYVLLGILNHKVIKNNLNMTCENELKLMLNLTKNMNKYEDFYDLWQILVDRIIAIVTVVTLEVNIITTPLILISFKNVLNMLTQTYKSHIDVPRVSALIKDLLEALDKMFAIESYSYLLPGISYDLYNASTILSLHLPTHTVSISLLNKILAITNIRDVNYNKTKSLIDQIASNGIESSVENDQKSETIKTPTPCPKPVPKPTKSKEANIVKTVVENGEEYVVVKSNWKFNPKKLTENQKEKLQRKREDIPALYQDLSQSQDEFKLVSWKTDSLDTTSSSRSESKSNKPSGTESASEILKNLPSSDVVPKILENIISENTVNINNLSPKEPKNVIDTPVTTPKGNKTPRMALKDRVFRNVRNLIENSGLNKQNASFQEPCVPETMNSPNGENIKIEAVIHSAPALSSADRPSRMKRKPKKFDDSLLLLSKRNRASLQDIHSNNDETKKCKTDASKGTTNNDNLDTITNTEILTNESIPDSDSDISNKNSNSEEKLSNIEIKEIKSSNPDVKDDVLKDKNRKSTVKNKETVSEKHELDDLTENLPKSSISDVTESLSPKEHIKESTDLIHITTPKSSRDDQISRIPNMLDSPDIVKDPSTPKAIRKQVLVIAKPAKDVFKTKTDAVNKPSPKSRSKSHSKKSIDNKITSKPNVIIVASNDITTPSLDEEKLTDTPSSSKDVKQVPSDEVKSTPQADVQDVIAVNSDGNDAIEIPTPEQTKMCSPTATSVNSNETNTPQVLQNSSEESLTNVENDDKEISNTNENNESTPKQSIQNKSTSKKTKTRKTRIEKELAIDMVEGHPFLKSQSERRLTRKSSDVVGVSRRKSTQAKLNKSQSETPGVGNSKIVKRPRGRPKSNTSPNSDDGAKNGKTKDVELQSSLSDELQCSEDVIESSQDSTITTISVKSTKAITKKVPVVCIEQIVRSEINHPALNNSQSILERVNVDDQPNGNQETNDDIMLPLNKTLEETAQEQSTLKEKDEDIADMDTEPIDDKIISEDIIIVSDVVPEIVEDCVISLDTQEIADADTQPTDVTVMEVDVSQNIVIDSESPIKIGCDSTNSVIENNVKIPMIKLVDISTLNNKTNELDASNTDLEKSNIASSPFKDEAQRQKDFLNNTVEISPIKTMSPDRDKTTPSPETSNDYVVITLTSPVHSNGEPFEKCSSPEVFTDEKVSPDNRDQSPPRSEVILTNTSPSSSLSLKKNKPQVRSGGRAAQMLGLCVPAKCNNDNVSTIVNPEIETEDNKKSSNNIPAKRNLRILYNSVNDNSDSSNRVSENEEKSNFLKFRRSLPAVDSSPSVSILKRKLVEIADDATVSPASKRKRVSFHDPPVSTTISVQKYIEPLRSPQNAALKRQERQLRQRTPLKSPKRLENVFKLDTVLTNTVESFAKIDSIPDDTHSISLDETPVVEVIRTSDLNDTDPICPDLVDCQDSIEIIAGELSSSAMKLLLVKELEGKVETVGDLAKMTEFEINRLCIKAPKVKVAKQVLLDYLAKINDTVISVTPITKDSSTANNAKWQNTHAQTDIVDTVDIGSQTVEVPKRISSMQTDKVSIAHASIQTNESGIKSTADIIQSCLSERPDFIAQLGEHLDDNAIGKIINKSSSSTITDMLLKRIGLNDVNRILENLSGSENDSQKELSFISDYLSTSEKFTPQDIVLFCSVLLKSAHNKLNNP